MSNMVGMDVEAVRRLAKTFGNKATDISNIIKDMNSQLAGVGGSDWKGKDANDFKHDWNANLAPALKKVAGDLRTAQNTANRNANTQDTTSKHL